MLALQVTLGRGHVALDLLRVAEPLQNNVRPVRSLWSGRVFVKMSERLAKCAQCTDCVVSTVVDVSSKSK